MARICHTNNCPVGVTTQKEELRKKFPGTPQNVVTFFQVQPSSERRGMGRRAGQEKRYNYRKMFHRYINAHKVLS